MRIVTRTLLGVELDTRFAFTKREMQTLRRAGAIADAARDALRERYGVAHAEELDIDSTLAGIDHGVDSVLDSVEGTF